MNQARLQKEQMRLVNSSLLQMFSKEQTADPALLMQYEKKIQELKQFEIKYNQLRVQFEEKNTVLHQARQDLFAAQEKSLILEKEKEEEFLQDLSNLHDEKTENLVDENRCLEEIVSKLVTEQSADSQNA